MPDFEVPLPTHHVLEVTPADPKQPTRSVGFLGLCIGGGAFATIYRDGAFGGAAESMVPVMEAHADAAAELRRSYKSERGRDVDCIVCMAHQDQREDELLAATGRREDPPARPHTPSRGTQPWAPARRRARTE